MWGLIATGNSPATSTASPNYSQLGMPTPEAMYKLAIPLVIPMTTNVVCTMQWAATVSLTGTSVICLLLDGKEARPLQ